jgi:hypothetical protein
LHEQNEGDKIRIAYIILLCFAFGMTGSMAASPTSMTCPNGTSLCNGTCTDTSVDELNCGACGNVCPLGKACINGNCSCLAGQTLCNGTCADTSFDLRNCGKCGNVCDPGKDCLNGACSCPGGLTFCNGTCTDITTDELNCGSCGVVCPLGEVCFQGRCLMGREVCNDEDCRTFYE